MEENGDKLYTPFTAPDKESNNAFYITSLRTYLPNEPSADIFISKIFEVDRTYMIIYRKNIPGIISWMLEEEADEWLLENVEEYGMAVDNIDPNVYLEHNDSQKTDSKL